ncbi:MAG: DUF1059 domain-containing protein [Candidatus Sericytochromatia bacterium]|uniref:DUF1059 domain-containing protein n=1 Tax=Candidatus Tanganyikabacteria bacterium TaxID=2961651 RepID=A0A937X3E1_9BACT|nr:DUF1059 domain-containing protein [Candidatus Tanganyikabacteria bacterium]
MTTASNNMGKTVRCLDIGLKCLFQAKGQSYGDLLQAMRQHVRECHDGMSLVPELERLIKKAVKDERWGRFAS